MGRLLLVGRLAARDLRRRPAEAALLLIAITAATSALTLGLVLHGVINEPYQSTRNATAGPDVVASAAPPPFGGQAADLAGLTALADAPGVVAHSGPYPYTQAAVEANGVAATAWTQGRDTAPALVDQPKLTQGSWVRDGGAVIEASFADALGIGAGDRIALDGRSFRVAGVAVTAASTPYPKVCFAPCWFGAAANAAERNAANRSVKGPVRSQAGPHANAFRPGPTGLVWLTEADARSLVTQVESLAYVLNLKLPNPAGAPAFVNAHLPDGVNAPLLVPWQDILAGHDKLFENEQDALLVGSWLLGLLALATIAVLVGARMADQIRRVGLLKAVGGTPSLVAAVLLAEYVVVALLATAAGLAVGRLAAPLLTHPGAGLVGSAGSVPFTMSTVGLVAAVALGIAVVATFVPAVRAARTSTVLALADTPRPPRRTAWLIAISARLPVPLLLGLRVAARRPRRTLLGVVSIAITVSGIVAALAAYAHFNTEKAPGSDPRGEVGQVVLLITIMLVAQAVVNAICITWATALDARRSSALARALGATPDQVSAGLSAAQALPALAGAILGLPGGIALAEALDDDDPVTIPPTWQLLAVVLGSVLVITALTVISGRIGTRRRVGEILQAELA
ncbi:MAG TPA: ABC transporter permease [Solirubrobacterales bacterium]|nr:ABC transporter permease [Solirubrobacterales bacterium]